MSTLLTAIKNRLLAYQDGTLLSVKTYKRGVLPPIPNFPAVVVLPIRETLKSPRSGGNYRNDREINIEIYTYGLKTDNILRTCIDLSDAVKDILKNEFKMNDAALNNTYDTVIGNQIYGEPQPFRNAIVQKCTIPIMCRSFESLPIATFSPTLTEVTPKDLLDEIYDEISAYTYTKTVKIKRKAVMPPMSSYPAICVVEDMDEPERSRSGVDRPLRRFTVAIFEKQLDKEVLLDNLLSIVENVKDCLQENHRWNDKCENSWVGSVEYGSYMSGNTILYSAYVMMDAYCYEELPKRFSDSRVAVGGAMGLPLGGAI